MLERKAIMENGKVYYRNGFLQILLVEPRPTELALFH
jgi:hypothetical protein